jgi:biotin carboxyl carrier protein
MKRTLIMNQTEIEFDLKTLKSGFVSFEWNNSKFDFELVSQTSEMIVLKNHSGELFRLKTQNLGDKTLVSGLGFDAEIMEKQAATAKSSALLGGLTAPMPGKIFKIVKPEGTKVSQGETILIMEAMKMEHAIKADKDGIVKKIYFKESEQVQAGVALAEISQ